MFTNPGTWRQRPGVHRATRATLAALAAGALLLGACGDDDDARAAADSPTSTTNTSSEDREDEPSPSAEDLIGTWASPSAREMTFDTDGGFTVTEGDDVLAEGTYEASSTTIELTPDSGPIACADPGTYEWEIEGDTLTLTAIDEPCPDRKEGLDGVPRTRVEPAPDDAARVLPEGNSEVSAGERVEASELGGLRFTVPEDRTVYQAPGLLSLEGGPAGINLVSVVETLDGDPIDSVDTVVSLIDEATVTLDEVDSTTIAGHETRVFDFTAAPERLPRPQFAVFRFEQGGVGGWGPVGEGRVWLLDTPRGILLFDAGAVEPGPTDVADGIAEAETIFRTLELVEVGS